MSDKIKAQSIKSGILAPSGKRHGGKALADKIAAISTDNERARALVERRMNWQTMNNAQKQDWLLDAVTFLLAADFLSRIGE